MSADRALFMKAEWWLTMFAAARCDPACASRVSVGATRSPWHATAEARRALSEERRVMLTAV
eukprot:14798490-Alexandrium_andersonii.AAC.1